MGFYTFTSLFAHNSGTAFGFLTTFGIDSAADGLLNEWY